MSGISCTLCSATSHLMLNVKEYIRHVKLFHAHRPDFKITCGIEGCQRMYRKPGTFFNHVYDVHGNTSQPSETSGGHDQAVQEDITNCNTGCTNEPTDCDNQSYIPSQDMLQKNSAMFLLGIKEKFKLTQVSLQGVIEGVTALNQQNINTLKSQIYEVTNTANIPHSQMQEIEKCFEKYEHPFANLETQHKQLNYYKRTC
ncbi:uncharacterized protein [Dysidea avara]|uniref:uncharacterized protein isoform X2 n=1 Tax=Dysidea avara TaxID=196820 RepID=UPI00332F0AD2